MKWTYGVDIIYYYYTGYDAQIKNIYHAISLFSYLRTTNYN